MQMPPPMMASPSGLDPSQDMYRLLLKERIVFLGSEVNDQVANLLIAQLIYLEYEDPNRDIWLYINSPGGSVTSGMAIYDTMQFVSPDVGTICMGLAASMGQFLLTAGAPGKRFALPNAEILMQQDRLGCIKPGAQADLLVVDGDPLADIGVLAADGRNLRAIMRAGEWVRNELA